MIQYMRQIDNQHDLREFVTVDSRAGFWLIELGLHSNWCDLIINGRGDARTTRLRLSAVACAQY
jgi:hypothetical protein